MNATKIFTAIFTIALSYTLSATARESQYIGPNGERLGLSLIIDNKLECTFEIGKKYFWVTLKGQASKRGALQVYQQGKEEPVKIGELILEELPDDVANIKVTVTTKNQSLKPDPSGIYQLLSYDEQLKLVRAKYTQADATLNLVYTGLMIRLPEDKKSALRDRQRDWIEHRDYMADYQAKLYAQTDPDLNPKEKNFKNKSLSYWESLVSSTESQSEFLKVYGRGNPKHLLGGSWTDGNGGLLELRPINNTGLGFSIDVVRGPTAHLGNLKGSASFAGNEKNKAVFVDTNKNSFIDGKPCKIEFIFDGETIELKSENAQMYHGVRAYFDGTYFRSGPLD